MMRVLGIDPGIRSTGWGVIAFENNRMRHLGNGAIRPNPALADTERLRLIHDGLTAVITQYQPDRAAIEQIFVAKSAASALRLGMARGVGLVVCGQAGLAVSEIAARAVKKAVSGTGTADKRQVQDMVKRLLAVVPDNADSADALAIAIAAANEAGHGLSGALDSTSGGLAAAIAAALARDDAGNGGAK